MPTDPTTPPAPADETAALRKEIELLREANTALQNKAERLLPVLAQRECFRKSLASADNENARLTTELAALRERVAALEAGLKPFAEFVATTTPGYYTDAKKVFECVATPTIGDCRRAAALLAGEKPLEPKPEDSNQ